MKDIRPFLRHILDECGFIKEKSENISFEKLNFDEMLKKAFVRNP